MAKFTGKHGELLVKGSGATPAYVAVAQVQEIGDISVTAEEVDVTTLDAGDYRDYIQGFKDPGECEFTVIFDPNLAAHDDSDDGLIGLFESGEVRDWAIRWNSSAAGGASYGLFKGFLRDMNYGALNADDPQTIGPLLRLTTPIALADALPATAAEFEALEKAFAERRARRRSAANQKPGTVPATAPGTVPATTAPAATVGV